MTHAVSSHATTIPDNSPSTQELGRRHQSTVESAFPNSPIHAGKYRVGIPTAAPATYPMYTALLNNNIAGGTITDNESDVIDSTPAPDPVPEDFDPSGHPKAAAKLHWSFVTHAEVSLAYIGPSLYPPVGTLHHAFMPNLLPPTGTNDNPKGENPGVALPEFATAVGRKLPIQPDQTSGFARAEKPTLPNPDEAGTRTFQAETIPEPL